MTVKKAAFIAAYTECLGDTIAVSKKLNMPLSTVRKWAQDPEVTAEREQMLLEDNEQLFAMARQTLKVAMATKADSTAAIFLMKAHQPDTFDEGVRRQRLANDATIEAAKIAAVDRPPAETREEWLARTRKERSSKK